MKKILVILFLVFIHTGFYSQGIHHCFNYSFLSFTDYLDKEKINSSFRDKIRHTSFNYKIEVNKYAVEFFYINSNQKVNELNYVDLTPKGSVLDINSVNLGVAYHYNIFNKKGLKISPHLGIVSNDIKYDILVEWKTALGLEPRIRDFQEQKFGLVMGMNFNYTVYKSLYLQSSVRYLNFLSRERLNLQSFICELGIGVRIPHDTFTFWEKK